MKRRSFFALIVGVATGARCARRSGATSSKPRSRATSTTRSSRGDLHAGYVTRDECDAYVRGLRRAGTITFPINYV